MKEAMDVLSTKILSRKQSVPSGDCRGSYVYRVSAFGSRRTTDTGLPTFDSKSSTPALLEPVDLVTDCSHQRPSTFTHRQYNFSTFTRCPHNAKNRSSSCSNTLHFGIDFFRLN